MDPGKSQRNVLRRRSTPCTLPTVTLAPRYARIFVVLLVGDVFSLIDPIPDFILEVGLLDELVVVPLGVILARKMMPAAVVAECRVKSRKVMRGSKKPVSSAAAVVMVDVWLLLATLGLVLTFRLAQGFGT